MEAWRTTASQSNERLETRIEQNTQPVWTVGKNIFYFKTVILYFSNGFGSSIYSKYETSFSL